MEAFPCLVGTKADICEVFDILFLGHDKFCDLADRAEVERKEQTYARGNEQNGARGPLEDHSCRALELRLVLLNFLALVWRRSLCVSPKPSYCCSSFFAF